MVDDDGHQLDAKTIRWCRARLVQHKLSNQDWSGMAKMAVYATLDTLIDEFEDAADEATTLTDELESSDFDDELTTGDPGCSNCGRGAVWEVGHDLWTCGSKACLEAVEHAVSFHNCLLEDNP